MRTVSAPAARLRVPGSKRLLALSGDERLVEHMRRGDELAFEVAFERHSPAILSFCRHMLGSREEAEDAVQQAFTSAYRDLHGRDREIKLKPWLFTIARNRCLSTLRARRERAFAEPEIATAGLAEQVERRGELRELLRDLDDLPEQQRAALLLSELSGLSHADIGGVLGCRPQKVKALVFRARSGLIQRRDARDAPCLEIREELANLRGGALRRGRLRHHLRVCQGCREFRLELKRQRSMLAAVLPVAPTIGLKHGVLGAIGLGGGSAGGGALLGGATAVKVATVCVLAGGGVVAGERTIDSSRKDPGRAAVAPATGAASSPVAGRSTVGSAAPRAGGAIGAAGPNGKHATSRDAPRDEVGRKRGKPSRLPPGQAKKVVAPAPKPRDRGRSQKVRPRKDKPAQRPKVQTTAAAPPKRGKPHAGAKGTHGAKPAPAAAPSAPGRTTSALRKAAKGERKAAKGR